jgi:carboxyl-terminal processing protease
MKIAPLLKPLVALFAVSFAFGLTFLWPMRNGLDLDFGGSERAQAARNLGPYDLTKLQVMNRAILEVKDHYVEPERVNPQRMLISGLNAIQRSVAPVLVHYEEGAPDVEVQVNDQTRRFRVDDVNAPWTLAHRFREVFGFLQENLEEEDGIELRDIEYAAVNGMLRTLDPHTVLLTPDVYEEMRMSTRGEFGGLGIVISIPDGHLTIMEPMPNTPASRAGLLAGDRIVKINDESTLNMPLSEAVDRLRGAPGSQVAVWIVRPGSWTQPRRFELTRDVIQIESIESRMLEGGVGYIKIKNFQGNTHDDLRRELAQLHRQGLRGLVLDLRDNPGGLLDQAVHISDTFLRSGTIVTTSSNDPAQRDEKTAHEAGTEPDYPLIVLVNSGSASASEIVAGALKAHDRAVIVGERTFGKGSVQVLYDFQDGSALKLTIAQYLTPGDVSIQGVGIVPDIAIDPMTVDREDMDLAADQDLLRESDLRSALTSERVRTQEQSFATLRYYLPTEDRQRLREADPRANEENEEEDEFLLRFSRELVSRATRSNRRELLRDSQQVIERHAAAEMDHAVQDLRRLGVDWSVGDDRGESTVRVEASTNRPSNTGRAGDGFELRVRVTNTGQAPLYQLRGTTDSDYRLFDGRELVFGRLEPGQSREWSTTLGICATENNQRQCNLPRDVLARADGIKIEFAEAHGHAPPPAEIRTEVQALPRPQFAYLAQVTDNIRGDGDGSLELGESGTIYFRIKNVGAGASFETQANLRNLSGRGVLLRAGRFELEPFQPGQERLVEFTLEVLPDFDQETAKLEISVVDHDLRIAVTENLDVPVAANSSPAATAREGAVLIAPDTPIRGVPDPSGEVVARVQNGAFRANQQAVLADWVRVDLGGGRPGWVPASRIATAGTGGTLAWAVNHMPPDLEVDFGQTLVTRTPRLRVHGRATDDRRVRDLYIFVGSRKVFYRSNRGDENARQLAFDTEVPLAGGINYVTVFARENDEVISRETFVVRRDAVDGSLMRTPLFDDDTFEEGAAEE